MTWKVLNAQLSILFHWFYNTKLNNYLHFLVLHFVFETHSHFMENCTTIQSIILKFYSKYKQLIIIVFLHIATPNQNHTRLARIKSYIFSHSLSPFHWNAQNSSLICSQCSIYVQSKRPDCNYGISVCSNKLHLKPSMSSFLYRETEFYVQIET